MLENLEVEMIQKLIKIDPMTKKAFCGLCQRRCASRKKTYEHIKGVHIQRRDVACLYCEDFFTTENMRNKHIYKHHNDQHKLTKLLNSW